MSSSSLGVTAVSGEPSSLNGVHTNSFILLASSTAVVLKYISTSEVEGTSADIRISNAVELLVNTIGFVTYLAAELLLILLYQQQVWCGLKQDYISDFLLSECLISRINYRR